MARTSAAVRGGSLRLEDILLVVPNNRLGTKMKHATAGGSVKNEPGQKKTGQLLMPSKFNTRNGCSFTYVAKNAY